jgi:uncharacterized membrane protein
VGFALPFLPFAFQRKLVMGLHLPLAFLAGVGAIALARWVTAGARGAGGGSRIASQRRASARLLTRDPRPVTAVVVALLLLTVPTNLHSIRLHVGLALDPDVPLGRLPTFLGRSELAALRWAQRRLPEGGLILCAPPNGMLIPALTGRPVYAGHWSETPHGHERLTECAEFYEEDSPAKRHAFLAQRGIRYVFLGPTELRFGMPDLAGDPHFRQLYAHDGTEIYELQSETTAAALTAADLAERS